MWEFHLAVSSGVDILTDIASDAVSISNGWDKFWEATYKKDNGLWLAAISLSTLITTFSFLGFSISFFKSVLTNKWNVALEQYVWVMIIMFMLADNGEMAVRVVKTMRYVAVEQTEVLYERTLAGVSIQKAITDILVSSNVKDQIRADFMACEAKTGQQQIECLDKVGELALKKIRQAEKKYGVLSGLERLRRRIIKSIKDIKAGETGQGGPISIVLGSATQASLHLYLKIFQFASAHLFELGLAMTGLYCPVALALSTLPLPTKFIWYWFQSYSSVAIAIWGYAVMVGIVAWGMVFSGVQTYTDTVFLAVVGVCAPFLSWKLASGGGTAIWSSVSNSVVTIAKFFL